MPTELEELVEFLHHGNTQIRQIAAENLVGYSTAQPSLFKRNDLEPVKDLKLLIKDYPPIAKNALTILVNLSEDAEVYENLIQDDAFVESLLRRVTSSAEPNANLLCMLLANMAKSEQSVKLLSLKRELPKSLSTSTTAIDQLLDCFVKGAQGSYNKDADYDYLSYPFADLSKHEKGRRHFLSVRKEDGDIVPLTKLMVFTEHKSTIRRRGVANTIKNAAFDVESHPKLLNSEAHGGIGLLPYLLLPLMGSEEYSDEDTDGMLDEVQLLDPDKEREKENDIIQTHLDTLLLLTTSREGRDRLRHIKVYPIIRELHLHVENDDVREGCDRLVQVLMRDEDGEGDSPRIQELDEGKGDNPQIQQLDEGKDDSPRIQQLDEDEQIVDIL